MQRPRLLDFSVMKRISAAIALAAASTFVTMGVASAMPLESPTIDVAVNSDNSVDMATTTPPDSAPERTDDAFYCDTAVLRRDTAQTVLSLLPPSGSNISRTHGGSNYPVLWPHSPEERSDSVNRQYDATKTVTTSPIPDGAYTAMISCSRVEPYDNSTGPGDRYISYATAEFDIPTLGGTPNDGGDQGSPLGSLGSLGSFS